MSIQINDINVIDDDRNFSAAGIVTVGTGNSATIIDGTTGITSVGIGITIEGVTGNISIAGTLTAAGFNIPANIVSFSPANGATDVSLSSSITLTFNQAVGVATTGTILLKQGSTDGTTLQTLGVSNIQSIPNGIIVNTDSLLPFSTTIVPIIPSGFIKSTSGDFVGLNTTGADSYSFTTAGPSLGQAYEGGYLICQAGGTRWVVSPSSAEVSRNWYDRANANTTAQAVSGCSGWFVPSCGQLQNPGYQCRTYWDAYTSARYWSNTPDGGIFYAFSVDMTNNSTTFYGPPSNPNLNNLRSNTKCVRSFRCVAY